MSEAAHSDASRDRPMRAVAMILTGMALLTMNDAIMKLAAARHPAGQLIGVRGIFALATIMLLLVLFGRRRDWQWRNIRAQVLNAVLTVAPLFIFVSALPFLSFSTAITISYTSPLFVAVLAPVILGERVGWRRGAAILLGFLGVALVAQPARDGFTWAALLPAAAVLFGASLSAGRDLLTRHLIRRESSVSLLGFSTAAATLVGLATMPFGWPVMAWQYVAIMAATGVLFSVGMFFIIDSFRWGDTSLVTPLRYSGVLWGAVLGYVVWSDVPNAHVAAGSILVIVSGLLVVGRWPIR